MDLTLNHLELVRARTSPVESTNAFSPQNAIRINSLEQVPAFVEGVGFVGMQLRRTDEAVDLDYSTRPVRFFASSDPGPGPYLAVFGSSAERPYEESIVRLNSERTSGILVRWTPFRTEQHFVRVYDRVTAGDTRLVLSLLRVKPSRLLAWDVSVASLGTDRVKSIFANYPFLFRESCWEVLNRSSNTGDNKAEERRLEAVQRE